MFKANFCLFEAVFTERCQYLWSVDCIEVIVKLAFNKNVPWDKLHLVPGCGLKVQRDSITGLRSTSVVRL